VAVGFLAARSAVVESGAGKLVELSAGTSVELSVGTSVELSVELSAESAAVESAGTAAWSAEYLLTVGTFQSHSPEHRVCTDSAVRRSAKPTQQKIPVLAQQLAHVHQ
jgi:hypothetical protein